MEILTQRRRRFIPTLFPGCILWLDSADRSTFVLDSSGGIERFESKTSNSLVAVQSSSGNRPLYYENQLNGLGAIRGNGSSQWLDVASFPSLANGYTIYAVSRSAGATNSALASINSGVTNSAMVIGNDSSVGSYVSQWGASVFQTVPSAGTDFARMVKYDGSHITGNYRIRLTTQTVDKTGTMTQLVGTPPAGTLSVLRSATTYSAVNVYEIIIYDRQTTLEEDARLKAYITDKWGLMWS